MNIAIRLDIMGTPQAVGESNNNLSKGESTMHIKVEVKVSEIRSQHFSFLLVADILFANDLNNSDQPLDKLGKVPPRFVQELRDAKSGQRQEVQYRDSNGEFRSFTIKRINWVRNH